MILWPPVLLQRDGQLGRVMECKEVWASNKCKKAKIQNQWSNRWRKDFHQRILEQEGNFSCGLTFFQGPESLSKKVRHRFLTSNYV